MTGLASTPKDAPTTPEARAYGTPARTPDANEPGPVSGLATFSA
jgi:hypothetical protein